MIVDLDVVIRGGKIELTAILYERPLEDVVIFAPILHIFDLSYLLSQFYRVKILVFLRPDHFLDESRRVWVFEELLHLRLVNEVVLGDCRCYVIIR